MSTGWSGDGYWTSVEFDSGNHYAVDLYNGSLCHNEDYDPLLGVCRRGVLIGCATALCLSSINSFFMRKLV